MYVDIPQDQILPKMEEEIKATIAKIQLPENVKFEIEKIEWTKKG